MTRTFGEPLAATDQREAITVGNREENLAAIGLRRRNDTPILHRRILQRHYSVETERYPSAARVSICITNIGDDRGAARVIAGHST
ncbi:hypothetical protein [Sphingomonas glacialis]|uniref:hypothetical protein n=1 Tax=Sphingomonas glacialis TaxID=658225 RepID=UPI0016776E4A|nr:hypothetical protein [Sphingomonas glacialis]